MRGRWGGEEGERGGGRKWGKMTACKDFLCVGSRFLQRAFCCQEAWLSLMAFSFLLSFLFFIIVAHNLGHHSSRTWRRPEGGGSEDGPV